MIEIQLLENQRREAKRQMFLTKPLRGYLGNQYHYWENEFKTTVDRINQIKKKK